MQDPRCAESLTGRSRAYAQSKAVEVLLWFAAVVLFGREPATAAGWALQKLHSVQSAYTRYASPRPRLYEQSDKLYMTQHAQNRTSSACVSFYPSESSIPSVPAGFHPREVKAL